MKIASSSIAMAGTHTLLQHDEKSESLKSWSGARPTAEAQLSPLAQIAANLKHDLVDISEAARRKQQQQLRRLAAVPKDDGSPFELSDADKLKIQMLEDFIERLTGKKIKLVVFDPAKLKIDPAKLEELKAARFENSGPRLQGWGLSYDFHQLHLEQEQTTFAAAGVVKTADGREIKFALDLNLSRQFISEENISIRAGDAAIDPLVVSFGGAAASLSQDKFAFDLDANGTSEQISFVGPGSGFLALDKNGDGEINDGKELFGPQNGDGFAELAAYDSDGNNWIDENDAIYDKLRIWTKDENGEDRLFALGQKGIGAIYLGNIDTAFAFKDAANDRQGQLRTSGVFLKEDGTPGTIQQIDLAV